MNKKIIAFLISILFIIVLFMQVVEYKAFDLEFYRNMHIKNDIAKIIGIEFDELMYVNEVTIDYIKGNIDSMDINAIIDGNSVRFFNDKEIHHMVDVKNLYQAFKNIKTILYITLFFLIGLFIDRNFLNNYKILAKTFLQTLALVVMFLVSIGVLILIDFNAFWYQFHLIFFTNDLWLLNPLTDRLIMMYPLNFFLGIIVQMLLIYSIIIGIVSLTALLSLKGVKKI